MYERGGRVAMSLHSEITEIFPPKIYVKTTHCPDQVKMRHELKGEHEIDSTVKEQLICAITG